MVFLKQAEDLRNLKYNWDKILNKRNVTHDERKFPKRRTKSKELGKQRKHLKIEELIQKVQDLTVGILEKEQRTKQGKL